MEYPLFELTATTNLVWIVQKHTEIGLSVLEQ